MSDRVIKFGLSIDKAIANLVQEEILPGLDLEEDQFWSDFAAFLSELQPKNKALLAKRDAIQASLDDWHRKHTGAKFDKVEYKNFLMEIGYLLEEGEDFNITTENVDPEISTVSGVQLVVPVNNARYALNAANARWGSLYDALYGTDAINEESGKEKGGSYNPKRGEAVISWGFEFLDKHFSLTSGSHRDVEQYSIENGKLIPSLSDDSALVGFDGSESEPSKILLKHHGLHVELSFNRNSLIGSSTKSGLEDIVLEAALTVIQDCEDSVAAVDGADKTEVYRNWLGLMKGDLSASFQKGGKTTTRTLNPDRTYKKIGGGEVTLPGRSVLYVRNVGHLMSNPAIILENGDEIQEGLMDTVMTALIAKHDIQSDRSEKNSRTNSMYVVKPKMHGPEEVAFAVEVFEAAEKVVGLPKGCMKIGIMDEERRTTVNLKECIREAKDRVVFINTGFLDRTGDEIHTSMQAGPMMRKADLKEATWIGAYEDWNVDVGLACGFMHKAQIGKGMWAMPDEMKAMSEQKSSHPDAGADTAWVPSPVAAILHSVHYHEINVDERQQKLLEAGRRASIDDLLAIPIDEQAAWSEAEIQAELDNNAQGILGYVVRWVDQGVGCSKVPDIHNVGLMEDRATLRISSQLLANWLEHGVVNKSQIESTFKRMAAIVDKQNEGDAKYKNMAPEFNNIAYNAALKLVFDGARVENGYTEPTLHAERIAYKNTMKKHG